MERRVYEIYGNGPDLDQLEEFLRHAEYLGHVGASRPLLLWVDGDGSGRIQIKKHGERINNKEYSTDQTTITCAPSGQYHLGG